ncbi:nuclear transport factor 2 family protein [uncultured Tateyamaria sp.]|uniref:nuclear transport factor 2 family protein n=1 Tax=uncultured Tateyamaria sp. TaxID=455651 RepID=UPI002610F6B7|nr:nuclear transport factor 2 family protein [uncultured Tateyamaria sp.]
MANTANAALSIENTTDEAHSFDEYKAIELALKPYIESAKSGDGALARTAFLDHAYIVGSIDGEHYNMDADTFAGAVTGGGPAPDVQHHIAWINVSGPAAAARVEFIHWGEHRFTDFFVLYKQDGAWKISGKVYDSHSKN